MLRHPRRGLRIGHSGHPPRDAGHIGGPIRNGVARGWHLVPTMHWGHLLSLAMFLGVLGLGLLRPRFLCKYVCRSAATFSLGNQFRLTERKVEASCIHCNTRVELGPFDAIKPDFTTRITDCTLCQTCAGVCPTYAIKFVERWNLVQLKIAGDGQPERRKSVRFTGQRPRSAAATVGFGPVRFARVLDRQSAGSITGALVIGAGDVTFGGIDFEPPLTVQTQS